METMTYKEKATVIHPPLKEKLRPTLNLLRLTFGIVPIVAGLDKFTNLIADWPKYLDTHIAALLPMSVPAFMMIIGVVEIAAGLIVLRKTEPGGYIVAAWLTLIALTLLPGFQYLDVAVRDLVMAVAAFSMARLSKFLS